MYLPKLVRDKEKLLTVKMYGKPIIATIVYLYLTHDTDIRKLEINLLINDFKGYRVLDILKYYGLRREHSNLFRGRDFEDIKTIIKNNINEEYEYKDIYDLLNEIGIISIKLIASRSNISNDGQLVLNQEDINNLNFKDKDAYFKILSKIRNKVVQDNFRRNLLLEFNKSCAICKINKEDLLVASHIIPYSDCYGDLEIAGDFQNGLLLCPLHDSLFESGRYITFDKNGRIIISHKISEEDYNLFNISKDIVLDPKFLKERRFLYLEEHRKAFILKNQEN